MASTKDINSAGIGIAAAGLVIGWAGIRNQSIIVALKDLAMGKTPVGNPKPAFTPIEAQGLGAAAFGAGGAIAGSLAGQKIVAAAEALKGQPYCFGGGHGSACGGKCSDCSGMVSCALNKAGVMKGTMATGGLANFGVAVPFDQRQAGDILVWAGGPGGGHCGIVKDATTMIHNPCTGCGGVQYGKYGSTRTGRTTVVRRAKAVAGG